jgi:hypothetical protein
LLLELSRQSQRSSDRHHTVHLAIVDKNLDLTHGCLNSERIQITRPPYRCGAITILKAKEFLWQKHRASEEFCDAASKTHINDNPAYYYNYAFATVFKFQLYDYIARKILHQPPQ